MVDGWGLYRELKYNKVKISLKKFILIILKLIEN